MSVAACPHCGSKNIRQGTIGDGVLTGYTSRNVCRDCGYQGMPIVFDSEEEYNKFLMEIPKTKKPIEKQKTQQKRKTLAHERPHGIALLAFVMILGGILTMYAYYQFVYIERLPYLNVWAATYYLLLSLIMAIMLPYGFFKGRGWAWTLAGILYVLSLPIGLLFLYYITRPHIRSYFNKT